MLDGTGEMPGRRRGVPVAGHTRALVAGGDGSIRKGGTRVGAWFTTWDAACPSGAALVAMRASDGRLVAASRDLGGLADAGSAGIAATVGDLACRLGGHGCDDGSDGVSVAEALVMLSAVVSGERPWSGHPGGPGVSTSRRHASVDGGGPGARGADPDAGAPACLAFLDTLDPALVHGAAAEVAGIAVSDPVLAFEAWKAARGPGEAAFVRLRRGVLEPDDIHVASIEVPTRLTGRGHGRRAFARLVELADAAGVPITLEASAASVSARWLQGWYGRLGFEPHPAGRGDWGPLMVRPAPAPSPRP